MHDTSNGTTHGSMPPGMHASMHAGMAEATRLTRAGEIAEATAVIQRTLGRRALGRLPQPLGVAVGPVPAAPRSDSGIGPMLRLPRGGPSGVISPPLPKRPSRESPAGGRFVAGSYTNRAGTRAYKVYVPRSYHGQALPLVVMLHGCTQGPDDFAAGTRMNLVAERERFFAVYPAQAAGANRSKCWNWFKPSDQRRDGGEPSLIAGITREVVSEYHLDARRIYVAGLSAGGAMAAIMGVAYPDVYAAIGVHSGLPYGAADDLPSAFAAMRQGSASAGLPRTSRLAAAPGAARRAVPAIVFHGDADTTVHPCNGDDILAQGAGTFGESGPGAAAGDLRVTVDRGQAPGGQAYTRSVYSDASGRAVMERWLIHGSGHGWSGGSPDGSHTIPAGPDASEAMVRFFLSHVKDAP